MSDTALPCAASPRSDTALRWVAGRLSAVESAHFEAHLATCDACQRSIELAATVRVALGPVLEDEATPGHARTRRFASGRVARLAAAAAVLVTAGTAWRMTETGRAVRRLGTLDVPPAVAMVPVRSAGSNAASTAAFDSAMAAYTAGRYADAARRLRRLVHGEHPDVMPAFFLGASELLQRDATGARDAFGLVLRAGPSPYQEEARFYRAVALLALGAADSAASELRLVAATPGAIGRAARDRLEALEAIRRR